MNPNEAICEDDRCSERATGAAEVELTDGQVRLILLCQTHLDELVQTLMDASTPLTFVKDTP